MGFGYSNHSHLVNELWLSMLGLKGPHMRYPGCGSGVQVTIYELFLLSNSLRNRIPSRENVRQTGFGAKITPNENYLRYSINQP